MATAQPTATTHAQKPVATINGTAITTNNNINGSTNSAIPPQQPPQKLAESPPHPLKALTFHHLQKKYSPELDYMLLEFCKLERQLLGAPVNVATNANNNNNPKSAKAETEGKAAWVYTAFGGYDTADYRGVCAGGAGEQEGTGTTPTTIVG